MILEEVRRNQFLPVYVQDYNRATRVPLADVIRKNKTALLIDTGMDYSGTGRFQSRYKIIISPQRKPQVGYLSGGIEN